ncbi:MAG: CidA/LrgA family protein [Bacillus subtilis]|nr:CidA/LrgA family protein [Bacillus subtilis]
MLLSKRLKAENVEDVGGFLTGNMSFFFLPAAISILEYLDLLRSSLLAILAVVVITLYLAFFAVAYAVKWTIAWQTKRGDGRG